MRNDPLQVFAFELVHDAEMPMLEMRVLYKGGEKSSKMKNIERGRERQREVKLKK